MTERKGARKCLVVGLDGATFDLLDPWMEEGLLPSLKKLVTKGARGELQSTIPPSTAPAWVSMVTGKNPGKHGIFDFRLGLSSGFERPLVSSYSIGAERLWRTLNRKGKRVGLINVPLTYPPEPVEGFLIAGMMTPGPQAAYAYPARLKGQLQDAIGDYVINIESQRYSIEGEEEALAFLKDVQYAFEKRRDALYYLMAEEDWDFLMVVFVLPDRIQHRLWKYLDERTIFFHRPEGARIREAVRRSFASLDETLGTLFRTLGPSTNIFLVSDHGFGPLLALINFNSWFSDLGILRVRKRSGWKASLFQRGVSLSKRPWFRQVVPRSIRSKVQEVVRSRRSLFRPGVEREIDWRRTQAYFAGTLQQAIYINQEGYGGGVGAGAPYEDLRNSLKEKLYSLRDPWDGSQLVDRVFFREEIYWGPYLDQGPDISLVAKGYSYLGAAELGRGSLVTDMRHDPRGFHRLSGIFVAVGKDIQSGLEIEGASIIDVAPTILLSMRLPLPQDMDGQVLDIFSEEFRRANPIQYETPSESPLPPEREIYSPEDREALEERLRGLGYLS